MHSSQIVCFTSRREGESPWAGLDIAGGVDIAALKLRSTLYVACEGIYFSPLRGVAKGEIQSQTNGY